ncbi:hypothetical protein P9139_20900 [Curtobacterium flaccumfaciens]|nr:hypothetical protein P9139_20900 [Curtobacterium flaccumfaciens]
MFDKPDTMDSDAVFENDARVDHVLAADLLDQFGDGSSAGTCRASPASRASWTTASRRSRPPSSAP